MKATVMLAIGQVGLVLPWIGEEGDDPPFRRIGDEEGFGSMPPDERGEDWS